MFTSDIRQLYRYHLVVCKVSIVLSYWSVKFLSGGVAYPNFYPHLKLEGDVSIGIFTLNLPTDSIIFIFSHPSWIYYLLQFCFVCIYPLLILSLYMAIYSFIVKCYFFTYLSSCALEHFNRGRGLRRDVNRSYLPACSLKQNKNSVYVSVSRGVTN